MEDNINEVLTRHIFDVLEAEHDISRDKKALATAEKELETLRRSAWKMLDDLILSNRDHDPRLSQALKHIIS